jgi:hypothetical protein
MSTVAPGSGINRIKSKLQCTLYKQKLKKYWKLLKREPEK